MNHATADDRLTAHLERRGINAYVRKGSDGRSYELMIPRRLDTEGGGYKFARHLGRSESAAMLTLFRVYGPASSARLPVNA